MTYKISVQRCFSYEQEEVREALIKMLEPLGGMESYVKKGAKVLVKPNMLSRKDPSRAATTHPSIIAEVVKLCYAAGASHVKVGDSPPEIFGLAEDFWKITGFKKACEDSGAELIEFEKDEKVPVTFRTGGKEVTAYVVKSLFEADCVINLPKMKTHNLTRITGATKNLFGLIPGFAKGMWHKAIPRAEQFAEFIADYARELPITLSIMDAIEAMDSQGPASGRVVRPGLLYGGAPVTAVDYAFCKIAGLNPAKVHMLDYTAKVGFGPSSMDDIEFVGIPIEEAVMEEYKVPMAPPMHLIPEWVLNIAKKLLWTGPVLKEGKCVKCGRCKKICPVHAIEITQADGALFDREKCISCFCCMEVCPAEAIEAQPSPAVTVFVKLVKRLLRYK